jgi:hypothetical protein
MHDVAVMSQHAGSRKMNGEKGCASCFSVVERRF